MRVIVIMAGGSGERFWPLSRRSRPKQFLALASDKSMLVETVERAQSLAGTKEIYIVAGPHLMPRIREILRALPAENFLTEPAAKNTAPCLGLAAAVIARRHGPDAVMGVLSADSLIHDRGTFERNADLAFEYAENNQALVTLGIRPRHPDTGFGYLEIGPAVAKDRRGAVHRVESFREKPDADTARHYVEMGHFLWNSGMFFWKVSIFLEALEKVAPAFASGVREIGDAYGTTRYDAVVRQVFEQWPSISIDFALMEQAENVCAVAGGFDWDDVGTWKALARTSPLDESGNVCVGKTVALDTRNCVLFNRAGREAADTAGAGSSSPADGCLGASSCQTDAGRNPLLVTLGVEDLVVVTTDDAVLVCRSDRAQDVKQLLKTLREKGHAEYL